MPGLGEMIGVHASGFELGPVPWSLMDLSCYEIIVMRKHCYNSFRPSFNVQLRTGTVQGSPTV